MMYLYCRDCRSKIKPIKRQYLTKIKGYMYDTLYIYLRHVYLNMTMLFCITIDYTVTLKNTKKFQV